MFVLAFDTTAAAVSVALWRDGQVVAAARQMMDQGQAEALMPLIESVMGKSGARYAELDRIAVTVGPGSFTGVRVGLAAARGLGLAADKPVIGVSTTEVVAAAVSDADGARILAAIDTKRGDFYVQQFDANTQALGEIAVVAGAALAAWLSENSIVIVGDGAAEAARHLGARARLSSADPLPDAAVLARLAASRAPIEGGPLPLYARAPDAVMPQHGGRLRP